MGASVLMTKLYIPVVSRKLVPRLRLLARIADGLIRSPTLSSAPPGFTKTTLLGEWRNTDDGREYPLASLATLGHGARDTTPILLHTPSLKPTVTALINAAEQFQEIVTCN